MTPTMPTHDEPPANPPRQPEPPPPAEAAEAVAPQSAAPSRGPEAGAARAGDQVGEAPVREAPVREAEGGAGLVVAVDAPLRGAEAAVCEEEAGLGRAGDQVREAAVREAEGTAAVAAAADAPLRGPEAVVREAVGRGEEAGRGRAGDQVGEAPVREAPVREAPVREAGGAAVVAGAPLRGGGLRAGAGRPEGRSAGAEAVGGLVASPAGGAGARRRGPADPVRGVMHRHHALIAGAVDEWEIAAGLEAQGVTDAGAHRLRHRDVFGLAEELYARVPRAVRRITGPAEGDRAWLSGRTAALYLLPGLLCVVAAGTAPAVLAAVAVITSWAALRRGPLRVTGSAGAVWTWGLIGFALYGPQAVTALRGDGRFDPTAGTATFTALVLSLAPAAYCAHWFAVRSRAQLAPSHGLSDFADAVRPRLAAALAVYVLLLVALLRAATALAGPAPIAGPAALGALLFTARLLAVHGHPRRAAAGLAAVCAVQLLAVAAAAAPPHLALPGTTTETITCAVGALALTAQSFRTLAHASAHRSTGPARRSRLRTTDQENVR